VQILAAPPRLEEVFVVPQQIKITVRRQDERVVSVTVGSIFGEATLTRRELEEMLAALQPDLSYENQTIRLKPGQRRVPR
jgi:hypothetical protein